MLTTESVNCLLPLKRIPAGELHSEWHDVVFCLVGFFLLYVFIKILLHKIF